jgi:hypothetical protein
MPDAMKKRPRTLEEAIRARRAGDPNAMIDDSGFSEYRYRVAGPPPLSGATPLPPEEEEPEIPEEVAQFAAERSSKSAPRPELERLHQEWLNMVGRAPADPRPAATTEPWERSAAGEDRIKRLQNLRDIAEGLGSFRATSGAQIRSGVAPRAPMQATDLRRELGEEVDTVTPEESLAFKRAGVDVPEGVEWKRLKDMGFTRPPSAYQKESLGLRRDELEMERQRYGLAKEHLKERQAGTEMARIRLGRPPAGQLDESLAIGRARKFLDLVERDYEEVKAEIGPVFGRLQVAARKFGLDDPRVSRLHAELTDAMGDYLTLKTGAQRGMPEMQFLLTALPKISDANATFEELLRSWRQRLDTEADVRGALFEELGYKGSGVEREATRDRPAAPARPRQVSIPKNDLEAIRQAQEDGLDVVTY